MSFCDFITEDYCHSIFTPYILLNTDADFYPQRYMAGKLPIRRKTQNN